MPERLRPHSGEEPGKESGEPKPEGEKIVNPEQEIPVESPEGQEARSKVEVIPELQSKELAKEPTKERELPEYTPEEIAGALRRHFEKMEAYSSELEFDKLLKALLEKLDKQQQEKVKALLREKARELQEKTKHLKTTLESLITIVKAISEALDRNRK